MRLAGPQGRQSHRFPHTPGRPCRQPTHDAALDPCSATKTIIVLGEERVLVIQEHKDGHCWCGQIWR